MPIEQTTGLMIPTLEEFADFKGFDNVDYFEVSPDQLNLFLRMSADLLILRTGLKKAPDANTPLGRIVSYGIMDLAWFLGTSQDEWTSMYSPFSSERIGSYSYSKTVSSAASKSDILDAPLFNEACKLLLAQEDAASDILSGISHSSERVFPNSYAESEMRDNFPGRW